LIARALAVELLILGFIALLFVFQYNKAQNGVVSKTKSIAATIGEQAGIFFSTHKEDATSEQFFAFLDERLGRKKLFDTFDIAPKFFSVVLRKDVERSGLFDQFEGGLVDRRGAVVTKGGGVISVSVPFSIRGEDAPYGFVKIDSDLTRLRDRVLSENFLLYAAVLLVLNNQAFILYLLLRRRREEALERGYLREHSIGALKIFHRVLGDIIEDHEREVKRDDRSRVGADKVVSLLEMFENRNRK